MNYVNIFKDRLSSIKSQNLYRIFTEIDRTVGLFPKTRASYNGLEKDVITWSSNDSLCMGENKDIIEAIEISLKQNGCGASGSRNLSGTSKIHRKCEKEIAQLHHKESALLFTSAYVANSSTISVLAKIIPNLHIFSDQKNHASIIEGISLANSQKHIYIHNSVQDLEDKLSALPLEANKLIIFESIYSMDGDIAPIKEFCDLAEKYQALTYIDEIHAVGMYGPQGSGYAAYLKQSDRIDIIQAGFSKGYGLMGGYITGNDEVIDCIRSTASGFIFTTSLPSMLVSGIRKSISFLRKNKKLRCTLQEKAAYLKKQLIQNDIDFLPNSTHIIPIMVRDANRAERIKEYLFMEKDIYLQSVNFPSVPKGEERFRAMVTVNHTKQDIDRFVEALVSAFQVVK